jgi:hypothetical protein
MASIKKVTSHLDAAQRQIEVLRTNDPGSDVLAVLTSLHAALDELAGIVRTDRV